MKFPWYIPVFTALLEGTDLPLQAKYDLKDDPNHVYLKMVDRSTHIKVEGASHEFHKWWGTPIAGWFMDNP